MLSRDLDMGFPKWIVIVVAVSGLVAQATAQSASGEVDVKLYRGIVHIEAADTASAEIVSRTVVDYDAYRAAGPGATPGSFRLGREPVLEIERSPTRLSVSNRTERHLIILHVRIPRRWRLKVEIVHYAEVNVASAEGPVELRAFQGRLQLNDVSSSVSAHLQRDGVIDAEMGAQWTGSAAFSVFDGRIEVVLPPDATPHFDLQSECGSVRNEFAPQPDDRTPDDGPILMGRIVMGDLVVRRGPGN